VRENGKVDFLIVGTQKGGTHALVSFLSQHPEIFIPLVREAHFFDRTRAYLADLQSQHPYATYHALFETAKPGQLWGEATPIYMFLPFVACRIFRYNPAVKLIFLLRDPAERAYSAYKMERARKRDSWPFIFAAALEPLRLRMASADLDDDRHPIRVNSYLSRGFYSRQVGSFLRLFPRENCLFIKSEALLGEHELVMWRVFSFLKVDPDIKVPAEQVFVGTNGELSPILAYVLDLMYRRDRARLRRLIGIEFADWS
jgi:Sulfotransferase domain